MVIQTQSTVDKNLDTLLSYGALGGTGRLVIFPIDHGFEHGPLASFGHNKEALDPHYHFSFADEVGVSAVAAPLGFLEEAGERYSHIPLILKVNSNTLLAPSTARMAQAQTGTIADAVRLGCVGVGVTIYPGAPQTHAMINFAQQIIAEARDAGLFTVLWCYPRGPELKGKEQAVDVLAYVAHIGALLGAHIIKVKLPNQGVMLDQHSSYKESFPSLEERIAFIVRSSFNGRRRVVFSGNQKDDVDNVLAGVRAIMAAGGHGSIIGRNIFQRPREEAVGLVQSMIDIYKP